MLLPTALTAHVMLPPTVITAHTMLALPPGISVKNFCNLNITPGCDLGAAVTAAH